MQRKRAPARRHNCDAQRLPVAAKRLALAFRLFRSPVAKRLALRVVVVACVGCSEALTRNPARRFVWLWRCAVCNEALLFFVRAGAHA